MVKLLGKDAAVEDSVREPLQALIGLMHRVTRRERDETSGDCCGVVPGEEEEQDGKEKQQQEKHLYLTGGEIVVNSGKTTLLRHRTDWWDR